MGLFLSMLDKMKPVLQYALKQQRKDSRLRSNHNHSNNERNSVSIPESLWQMKEPPHDDETMKTALIIAKLLEKEELAGPDSIFYSIANGAPIKGKLIRSYVASLALKKDELSVRKMFVQMLLNTTFEGTVDEHVSKITRVFGDDPVQIKEKVNFIATDTFVSMDDSDFDALINKIL